MKREEIIQCKDKKGLIDYIKKKSSIPVFEGMDLILLKSIALNIPVVPQTEQAQEKQEKTEQEQP